MEQSTTVRVAFTNVEDGEPLVGELMNPYRVVGNKIHVGVSHPESPETSILVISKTGKLCVFEVALHDITSMQEVALG